MPPSGDPRKNVTAESGEPRHSQRIVYFQPLRPCALLSTANLRPYRTRVQISAQIKRCFPDHVICVISQGRNGPTGFETGMRAVEGFSSLLGVLL